MPPLAQGFLGTSRRAKQIDSSETEIAMTPIAMPVAGLPWSNSRKINVDTVCIPGGRIKSIQPAREKKSRRSKSHRPGNAARVAAR